MSDSSSSSLGAGSLRRVIRPDDAPSGAAEVLARVRDAALPGLLPIVEVADLGSGVVVQEQRVEGVDFASAIDAVHAHISTSVALAMVGEAARSLSRLHGLKTEQGPLVHGHIGLESLVLAAEPHPLGQVLVHGIIGERGRPDVDIRGLLDVLRRLLQPKAGRPGGAELLDRLGSLRFQSAADLATTIDAHLERQGDTRVEEARARFLRRVLRDLGGARPAPSTQAGRSGEVDAALAGAFSGPIPSRPPELPPPDAPFFDSDATEAVLDPLPNPADGLSDDEAPETALLDAPPVPSAVPFDPTADLSLDPEPAPNRSRPPPPPPPASPITERTARQVDSAAARDGLMAPAAAREDKSAQQAVLVGDYRVVAAIGKGGMGEIYLARARSENRLVALKVLGAAESGDDEALGMLMDEARIMARIEHPHVLKVVDFGRAHGRIFLASEYLEGRPLVRVMIASYDRAGGMEHTDVACVGAQSARGLHAAHTATTRSGAPLEVVHRDVSPQNIFLTYAGLTKVIDFGVARASERVSRTQVGLVKGKAAYMSPEQAEGQVLDARSDVFSLGVCLWEMVAGKRLFKRPLDYDTLVAVQTARIEPPSEVRGQPDTDLDRIILNALERDRERRTPSAEVLAEQLEAYARSRGVEDRQRALRTMMQRLFGEEADKERALVEELEARAATEADAASLRELSGVAYHGDGREMTLVAEPDALGVLDRYGEARQEITGERVIRKVGMLEAERLSGEFERVPRPVQEEAAPATALDRPRPRRIRQRRRWGLYAVAAMVVIGLAVAIVVFTGPGTHDAGDLSVEEVEVETWVAKMVRLGAEESAGPGPVRRLEGLGAAPLIVDAKARIRWVKTPSAEGWLVESPPVDGAAAVNWVRRSKAGLKAHGLSVNDCPAAARPTPSGLVLDYGGRSLRVPYGGGRTRDVLVEAPEEAVRLELRPLGVVFGAAGEAPSCPTGWELGGRVLLERLPILRYELVWSDEDGEEVETSTLDVTARGVTGGEAL